jgi:hypothetical protein
MENTLNIIIKSINTIVKQIITPPPAGNNIFSEQLTREQLLNQPLLPTKNTR